LLNQKVESHNGTAAVHQSMEIGVPATIVVVDFR